MCVCTILLPIQAEDSELSDIYRMLKSSVCTLHTCHCSSAHRLHKRSFCRRYRAIKGYFKFCGFHAVPCSVVTKTHLFGVFLFTFLFFSDVMSL